MSQKKIGLVVLLLAVGIAILFHYHPVMLKKQTGTELVRQKEISQQKVETAHPYGFITAKDGSVLSFNYDLTQDKDNIYIILEKPGQKKETFGWGYPESLFIESQDSAGTEHVLVATQSPNIFYAKMNLIFNNKTLNLIYDFIDIQKKEMLSVRYSPLTHQIFITTGENTENEKKETFSLSPFKECQTISLNATLDETGQSSVDINEKEKCETPSVVIRGVDKNFKKVYFDFEDNTTHTVTSYVRNFSLPSDKALTETKEQPTIEVTQIDKP